MTGSSVWVVTWTAIRYRAPLQYPSLPPLAFYWPVRWSWFTVERVARRGYCPPPPDPRGLSPCSRPQRALPGATERLDSWTVLSLYRLPSPFALRQPLPYGVLRRHPGAYGGSSPAPAPLKPPACVSCGCGGELTTPARFSDLSVAWHDPPCLISTVPTPPSVTDSGHMGRALAIGSKNFLQMPILGLSNRIVAGIIA